MAYESRILTNTSVNAAFLIYMLHQGRVLNPGRFIAVCIKRAGRIRAGVFVIFSACLLLACGGGGSGAPADASVNPVNQVPPAADPSSDTNSAPELSSPNADQYAKVGVPFDYDASQAPVNQQRSYPQTSPEVHPYVPV